jgi:hypothetical protein
MNKLFVSGFLLVCFLAAYSCGARDQDDIQPPETSSWNTFLGSSDTDVGCAAVADDSGNVYVAGYSYATWGSPIAAYTEFNDTFVAKLNRNGNLVWSTFLGPTGTSGGHGCSIALDGQGNTYVTGLSTENWGSPINPHVFGYDTFVAKLGNNGELVWNTFLNSNDSGYDGGIAVSSAGDIFVIGASFLSWGSPVRPFAGPPDVFVAKLNNGGHIVWNTFLGSDSFGDDGHGVAADSSGNVYAVGSSSSSWGSPIRPKSGSGTADGFVAKLDGSGHLLWNTFLGTDGGAEDYAEDVVSDHNGAVYVVGTSKGGSWGSPIRPYDYYDAFVAKLSGTGALIWNTFLGSPDWEDARDVTLDGQGHVFVAGSSCGAWGPGAVGFVGYSDAFLAELEGNGNLLANAFRGSTDEDHGEGLAVDAAGRLFLIGSSWETWGQPVRPFSGAGTEDAPNKADVFVARLDSLR